MAMAALNKMHLMLKTPVPRGFGRFSSVSMHSCYSTTVVVSVHDVSADLNLYYRVGVVDKDADVTEWGNEAIYDTGKHPSVSLVFNDDSLYVIECHCSDAQNRCFYHVGKVDVNNKTINFGNSIDFCDGKMPKVSANNDGTIIIVKEQPAPYSYSTVIQYFIGKINTENSVIDWKVINEILDFQGAEPDISTTLNQVVVVCRNGSTIQFKMGTIENSSTIVWKDRISSIDTAGNHPSVSINSHGNIVAFHQEYYSRALCFWYGCIKDNVIVWNMDRVHDNGEYTTVFLSEDRYIYEMHKSRFGRYLWCTQGELKENIN